ncbi:MAG TPA: type II toxin-antitoxin system PemK/MazF family toxin [Micromonosporaceae bacterium]|nr:type II toxin-antitoxin system PemK/MazF family toxin [Micromonosporaceae bacterium]
MRRGEVYEYTVGSQRARVVIVSATRYSPRRGTFAVVLGADVPAPPVAVLVPTAAADPVRGTIDVSRLRPVDPSAIHARIGKLVPDTLRQVDRALRTYFDLL